MGGRRNAGNGYKRVVQALREDCQGGHEEPGEHLHTVCKAVLRDGAVGNRVIPKADPSTAAGFPGKNGEAGG